MESLFAVLYQPAAEGRGTLPAILAAMHQATESVPGRIYYTKSTKSCNELLADLKKEIEPGDSLVVIKVKNYAYFGKAPFATAIGQMDRVA